jgi:2-[(L-alanin-3-ylcarbamoyl)methyl]-2-hydroxybutanedioate decarboxylase
VQFPPSAGGVPALAAETLPRPVRRALDHRARRARATGTQVDGGYLYLPEVAAARAAALRAVLPGGFRLCFAVKANSFRPVLRALAGAVDGFEVASAAEAAAARDVAPGGLVVAAGPGKSTALLRALVDHEVDLVNVESVLELRRLDAAARAAGRRARVALRVNPRTAAPAGALTMGGVPSAFGIAEADVPAALEVADALPGVTVAGVHVHAASGVLDAAAYAGHVRACLELAARLLRGRALDVVDVGGGIGVPFGAEAPFDLGTFGDRLADLRPPAGTEVVLEPGRYLAAECGWYAAEVTDVKHAYGTSYAVLRGGINHFQLPASWDLVHRFAVVPVEDWPPGVPRPEARGDVTVVGELCTPEDTLARDVRTVRVRAGDLVVFPLAGAYGWEFAMPAFLGHPPATREVAT